MKKSWLFLGRPSSKQLLCTYARNTLTKAAINVKRISYYTEKYPPKSDEKKYKPEFNQH